MLFTNYLGDFPGVVVPFSSRFLYAGKEIDVTQDAIGMTHVCCTSPHFVVRQMGEMTQSGKGWGATCSPLAHEGVKDDVVDIGSGRCRRLIHRITGFRTSCSES